MIFLLICSSFVCVLNEVRDGPLESNEWGSEGKTKILPYTQTKIMQIKTKWLWVFSFVLKNTKNKNLNSCKPSV